jgi:hypothetical protein
MNSQEGALVMAIGRFRNSLHDLAMLSDLLALAPSEDEHPMERPALVHSIERLSGVDSEPLDLSRRLS